MAACAAELPEQPATATSPGTVQLRTDSAGLVQTKTATGTSVKLDGRFQNAMVARRNADGSLTVECHDDTQQAEAFLQGPERDAANHEVQ